jgi:transposase-like protein
VHGKYEPIRDLLCQVCHKKFTVRRHTVLYRLKTHSATVRLVLNLLALGGDPSAIEEVLNLHELTIRTWLYRSGEEGRKLHQRFLANLDLVHVQLDEC